MFAALGFPDAKTLLASGNVVFQSDQQEPESLIEKIESAIQSTFGFESKVILRTQDELQTVIENNPFDMDDVAGNKLLVTFLRVAPDPDLIPAFKSWHTGAERVHFVGDEIFAHYVDGIARSKLTGNAIESKLKVVGTARNWNTILKLQSLADKVGKS